MSSYNKWITALKQLFRTLKLTGLGNIGDMKDSININLLNQANFDIVDNKVPNLSLQFLKEESKNFNDSINKEESQNSSAFINEEESQNSIGTIYQEKTQRESNLGSTKIHVMKADLNEEKEIFKGDSLDSLKNEII